MKGISSAKLILLHKQPLGGGSPSSFPTQHRLLLVAVLSLFTFVSLLTLLTTTATTHKPPSPIPPSPSLPIPAAVADALLHYAAASNASGRMPPSDLRAVAAVLRRRGPCNLLVFGLGHETPLWRALNHGGRTVFLDESEYYISILESRHPNLEAYDVAFTTRVADLDPLLASARGAHDCRPSQNLLFSDCRLAINDLPNALYDVPWDVILVDGPRGYDSKSPGRMSAIFTAAVMARYRGGAGGPTEVLVHDYEREVERRCSEEFLCRENRVSAVGQLAHFVIPAAGRSVQGFCANRTASAQGL